MFKLQSPSKYSPLVAVHLSRCFFHCSKQFLNLLIVMPFSASAVFLFYLFHISKTFPFEDFFHPRKQQQKLLGVRSGEEGWWGTAVMLFLVKHYWTLSMAWAGTLVNRHHKIVKHVERVFQKNSVKLNAASHNTTSWCTDPDGFLEFSPSREACTARGPPTRR